MSTVWTPTEPRPEIRWDVTDEEYYADHSAISQSMRGVYIESPQLYQGVFITKEFPRKSESNAKRFGKAFHLCILQPDKYADSIMVFDTVSDRSKAGIANVEKAKAAGKVAIDTTEEIELPRMRASIMGHPLAKMLLEKPRETEIAFRWHDAESGLECKAKLDGLVNDPEESYCIIVDLKSTKDPTPEKFPKSIVEYGYDIQAAQYCIPATLYTGKSAAFVFIAVRNTIPWDCFVYRLENTWLTAATRLLAEGMAALSAAYRNDYWFAPGQEELTTLDPPAWARQRLGL